MPFIIQFANAIYSVQDVRSFITDSTTGALKTAQLHGLLSVFSGGQPYLQGSHENCEKYKIDVEMTINLSETDCYAHYAQGGVALTPNPTQVVLTKLPNAS